MRSKSRRYPYLAPPTPIAFTHRGSSSNVRENSWAAFEAAVALGYTYLETDVRRTRDGVIVSCHDKNLWRVAGLKEKVSQLSYAELSARLAAAGETELPRLAEMLERWPHIRFNIDIKSWDAVEATIEVIKKAGAIDRVCVASFSDFRTARARRLAGDRLCTALGPVEVLALKLASRLGISRIVSRLRTPAAVIQVSLHSLGQTLVDAQFVKCAHQLNLKVHVWTINDRPTIERLLDLGVDGIMTDEAELVKTVFIARGLWPSRDD